MRWPRSLRGARSPEDDALVGRDVHPVARARPERFVEGGLVHGGSIGAKFGWRVRIDLHQADDLGLARLLLPRLRPAEEEALVAGPAVDHGRGVALEGDVVGLVGDGEAGVVGDVLAQRELAVDRVPRDGAVAA